MGCSSTSSGTLPVIAGGEGEGRKSLGKVQRQSTAEKVSPGRELGQGKAF
jgi:hypothetical protein